MSSNSKYEIEYISNIFYKFTGYKSKCIPICPYLLLGALFFFLDSTTIIYYSIYHSIFQYQFKPFQLYPKYKRIYFHQFTFPNEPQDETEENQIVRNFTIIKIKVKYIVV